MTTALVSAYTGIPIRCDVCMTGEITLRGEVLAIGGLKEKLLAAVRGGLQDGVDSGRECQGPNRNFDNIKNKIEIIPVKWIDQVLERRWSKCRRHCRSKSMKARRLLPVPRMHLHRLFLPIDFKPDCPSSAR